MLRVFNYRRAFVMAVVVFVFLLMQIGSFAGEAWKQITQFPTLRVGFATAVVDNKIYLIGGTLFENVKAGQGPYGISTVEVYDTQTNTWQRVADMPTPRQGAKAGVVNGIIFVFGGWNGEVDHALREYPVSVDAYNPQTDTWMQKKDMPVPRANFGLGVVDGNVSVIGGVTRIGGERINRVDVYNSATDTWVKGREMPTPREYLGVGVVGNHIYAIGGLGWPRVRLGPHLTVLEAYDSSNRQWRKKSDMLDPRDLFETVTVGDSVYIYHWREHSEGSWSRP